MAGIEVRHGYAIVEKFDVGEHEPWQDAMQRACVYMIEQADAGRRPLSIIFRDFPHPMSIWVTYSPTHVERHNLTVLPKAGENG